MTIRWNERHVRTMATSTIIACISDPGNTLLADINEKMSKIGERYSGRAYDAEIEKLKGEAFALGERVVPLLFAELDRRIPIPK